MSISSASKRGRPRVDAVPVNVRFPPEQLSALDKLIGTDPGAPSRPEFIRRVIELLAGPKEERSRLKTFRLQEPGGLVVLDLDQIITIETDYVYSRVTVGGGRSFKLWEEPERLAAQLGFYLQFGDQWVHPDAVSAIAMGDASSIVHLVDGRSVEVSESWEAVSHAVDEARKFHGTPVPPPKPDLGGPLRRRYGSSGS